MFVKLQLKYSFTPINTTSVLTDCNSKLDTLYNVLILAKLSAVWGQSCPLVKSILHTLNF